MDGILIVNKPKQYTSHDVCAKIKKIGKTKVGHTGTLDPMATGVLPLLLGQGTKLSAYITNHSKTYEAVLQLGIQTDTADAEGKVIKSQAVQEKSLEEKNIAQVLKSLEGKQTQLPPKYSAIKVNGKKLYEYARKNEAVEIPKREIEIYKIELLEIQKDKQTISFRVQCSKGTYIRTLCETIAIKLETVGYMKELTRTRVGQFHLENAITIEQIEQNKENAEFFGKHIITIEDFFEDVPSICLDEQKLVLFLNGVQLTNKMQDGIYKINKQDSGEFIGIGTIKNNLLKRKLIIEN